MKRNTALKVLNPIMALLFVTQAASGFGHDLIGEEAFEVIHEGGGTVLVIAVVLHVILNWPWIKATFFKRRRAAQAEAAQ